MEDQFVKQKMMKERGGLCRMKGLCRKSRRERQIRFQRLKSSRGVTKLDGKKSVTYGLVRVTKRGGVINVRQGVYQVTEQRKEWKC